MVLGAGLAGLSAARDLAAAGADVVVLEARERPGGRVEQELLPDGRPVQWGGEVVADWMHAYVELVDELGLTLEPSYTAIELPPAWGAAEGVSVGERAPWMDDADSDRPRSRRGRSSRGSRASVDPADPWSHPEAERLDRLSMGAWLRSQGARPGVIRYLDHMQLSLSIDSVERTSLLAQLRKEAVAGARGFYDERHWEHLRVAEGSATRGAADGRRARRARPARERRRGARRDLGPLYRLPARRRPHRGRGGRLRPAGRPAARRDGERRVGGAARFAPPPAQRAGRQDRRGLPELVLGRRAAPLATGSGAPSGSSATASSRRSRRPTGSAPSSPRPSRSGGASSSTCWRD